MPATKPRVLVVGAGFAGVAAAAALREGGLEDVLVLEAQDRAGGRVTTVQLDDGYLEPGAQFIHGQQGNLLHELAVRYGLLTDSSLQQGEEVGAPNGSAEDHLDNQFFTSQGRLLQPHTVARLVRGINKVFTDYANCSLADKTLSQTASTMKLNDPVTTLARAAENEINVTSNGSSDQQPKQASQDSTVTSADAASNGSSFPLNGSHGAAEREMNCTFNKSNGAFSPDTHRKQSGQMADQTTTMIKPNYSIKDLTRAKANETNVTFNGSSDLKGSNDSIVTSAVAADNGSRLALIGSSAASNQNTHKKPSTGEAQHRQLTIEKHTIVANTCNASTPVVNGSCSTQWHSRKPDDRYLEVLRNSLEETLSHGDEPEDIKFAVLEWVNQWEYTDNAAKLTQLALPVRGRFAYPPGNCRAIASSGLEDIHRALVSRSLPPSRLLLNKPVRTVFWADSQAVRSDLGEESHAVRTVCWPESPPQGRGQSRNEDEQGQRGVCTHTASVRDTDVAAAEHAAGGSQVCAGIIVVERIDATSNNSDPPAATNTSTTTPQLRDTSTATQNKAVRVICDDTKKTTTQNKAVRVLCDDGEELWADHVIVTSSAGFLQAHEATLFSPRLPECVRRAVQQLGFGSVAKVFLLWDVHDLDLVLDPAVDGLQFLWLRNADRPLRPPSDLTARKTQSGGAWYDTLQGFERVPSHQGALLTWLAGEEADIMEALPEPEVKAVLHELLMQFTGNSHLPAPRRVVRSQWHSNPFVLGGYSYMAANMDPGSHSLLSVPLPSVKNPVLLLSGEATSQHYSTVNGAIDSGQRAARAILRHYSGTS